MNIDGNNCESLSADEVWILNQIRDNMPEAFVSANAKNGVDERYSFLYDPVIPDDDDLPMPNLERLELHDGPTEEIQLERACSPNDQHQLEFGLGTDYYSPPPPKASGGPIISTTDGAPLDNQRVPSEQKGTSMTRPLYSKNQLAELERTFAANRYLTRADFVTIATRLNLTTSQVKMWFQNKRKRRNGKETNNHISLEGNGRRLQGMESEVAQQAKDSDENESTGDSSEIQGASDSVPNQEVSDDSSDTPDNFPIHSQHALNVPYNFQYFLPPLPSLNFGFPFMQDQMFNSQK